MEIPIVRLELGEAEARAVAEVIRSGWVAQGPEGASDTVTTRVFGNEATGDLDGDGKPDTAFLLTQETGGTGVFFPGLEHRAQQV